MASDDMLSWLRATIEGDKAAAEANGDESWTAHDEGEYDDWTIVIGDGSVKTADSCGCCCKGTLDEVEAKHIALHDPRDTITRCEAELALLDLHEHVGTSSVASRLVGGKCEPFGCAVCHEKDQIVWGEGVCATVRLLATGWRHRPGFNPEWVEG